MARVLRLGFPFAVNSTKTRLFSASETSLQSRIMLVCNYSRKTWGRTPIKVTVPGVEEDEASWKAHSRADWDNSVAAGVPQYEKLREDSKVFTHLMTIAKSRNLREKKRKIVLEGQRLINDALDAGVEADAIFFSQEEKLRDLALSPSRNVKLYKITYNQLSLWSNLTTSPGLIGVFNLPDSHELTTTKGNPLPLTVICDNVREPGNLGAILRCTAAVGCKQVLLTKGCVDIWDQKVLRAACGAHFRAAIANNVEWDEVCNYISQDSAVYLASKLLDDADFDVDHDANFDEPFDATPRQRPGVYEVSPEGRKIQAVDVTGEGRLQIDSTLYHDVDYSHDNDIVVIVGGETEGLSREAIKFTYNRYGRSIFIPLKNCIESLNSGVALGIILFEIQRQLRVVPNRRLANPP